MDKNPADITDAEYLNDVNPTPAGATATASTEDDPPETGVAGSSEETEAATFKGKLVFNPSELNQAGEDKEYFHPDKGHKFDAPQDANDHALKPDVEVTPDNEIKRI